MEDALFSPSPGAVNFFQSSVPQFADMLPDSFPDGSIQERPVQKIQHEEDLAEGSDLEDNWLEEGAQLVEGQKRMLGDNQDDDGDIFDPQP